MVLFGQALELRPLEAGSGESIFEVRRLGAVKVTDVVEQFVARLPPVGTASATALELGARPRRARIQSLGFSIEDE